MLDGIKSFISGASNYIYNLATGQTDKSTSIAQNKLSEPPENSERKSLLGRNISSDLTGASSIFSNLISRITSIFSKQIKGEKITVNEIQTNLIGTLPKITAEDLKDPLITQTAVRNISLLSDEDKKKFQEAILNFASKVSVDTLNENPLKDIILKTVLSLSHENKNNHKIQNYILNIAFVSKASQESNLPGARVGVPKLKMQSMINLINAIDGMDIKRHSFFRHYIYCSELNLRILNSRKSDRVELNTLEIVCNS